MLCKESASYTAPLVKLVEIENLQAKANDENHPHTNESGQKHPTPSTAAAPAAPQALPWFTEGIALPQRQTRKQGKHFPSQSF